VAKSIFAERMDEVQSLLWPKLKAAGFCKRGRTFNRSEEDGIVQVINLQMWPSPIGQPSALDNAMYGTFAVNLGVYISEVYAAKYPKIRAFPIDADCAIRTRLDRLIGESDFAWSLKDKFAGLMKPKVDALAASVWEAMEREGFPFLERYSTRAKIIDDWIGEPGCPGYSGIARVDVAIMKTAAGDMAAAAQLLDEHIGKVDPARPNGRFHVAYVRELAERLGLRKLAAWPPEGCLVGRVAHAE